MRWIQGYGKVPYIKDLWKQGWNEIPAVMLSFVGGVVGVGCMLYSMKRYLDTDSYHTRYKGRYIVYRPDNPKIAHIKEGLGPYVKSYRK